MFIAPVDATRGEDEWRPFVESHPFGHLVVPGGPDRDLPVVVPTQFVLQGDTVWLHLVRANPVFGALAENPRVLLSVADDWAFIPSSCRRSSCSRVTRCGCIWCGPIPRSVPWTRIHEYC